MILRSLLLGAALLWSAGANAEQFVDAGAYRVHYVAINTTQLLPEIARQFGHQRLGAGDLGQPLGLHAFGRGGQNRGEGSALGQIGDLISGN